jgi:hypothetical protein
MKTIIKDASGDKLKVREGKVEIEIGEKVVWKDNPAKVTDVFYDATIDARIIVLDIDLKPEEIGD